MPYRNIYAAFEDFLSGKPHKYSGEGFWRVLSWEYNTYQTVGNVFLPIKRLFPLLEPHSVLHPAFNQLRHMYSKILFL